MTAFTTNETILDLNDSTTAGILSSSPSLATTDLYDPDFGSRLYGGWNLTYHDNTNTTLDQSYVWALYNLPSITFLTLNLLIGVIGNSVVIYVYGFCMKATPMNSFIVSLAILDIVTCSVGIPLMILQDMLPYIVTSNPTCKLMHFVYSTTIIASSLVLVTIAVDRYRRICQPLSGQLNVTQVRLTTILLVIIATVTCIPVILMAGALEEYSEFVDLQRKFCYLEAGYINSVYSAVFYSYKSAVILITIIITSYCYFRIWFAYKIPPKNSGDPADHVVRRMSVRAASVQPKIRPNVKKMFMITLLYIISFVPSICVILILMSANEEDKNLHPVAISFVHLFRRTYLLSCSLNPFICWYCNATFRLHVKSIASNWFATENSTNSISEATSSKQNDELHNAYTEKIS